MDEAITAGQPVVGARAITGLNHISVPVRDRPEAVRFWQAVAGAEILVKVDVEPFTLLRMPGNFDLGVSEQPGGWTAPDAEYPHYAFDVDPELVESLKAKLDELGIPNQGIWTRFQSEVLLYFRDPSGNLFEIYCHEGYGKAREVPVGHFYGGDFVLDFQALNYENWNDPGK